MNLKNNKTKNATYKQTKTSTVFEFKMKVLYKVKRVQKSRDGITYR